MNKVRNFCIVILAIIIVMAVMLTVSYLTKKPQLSIDFTITTHTGETVTLHENIGRTGTVLIFIDPEVEGSNTVTEKVIDNNTGADIIAVSVSELPQAEQESLLSEKILGIEKLCFDGADAIQKYNVGNAPVTYFIDSRGYVQNVFMGSVKDTTIQKYCQKIIEE